MKRERRKKLILLVLKSLLTDDLSLKNEIFSKKDIENIIDFSLTNGLSSIIYMALKKLEKYDDDFFKLKKQAVYDVIREKSFINEMIKIIRILRNNYIDLIVLKGLFLRNLYDEPCERNMEDADILIKKRDSQKVRDILIKEDYIFLDENHNVHDTFIKNSKFKIEIHYKLINEDYFTKDAQKFESSIQKNTVSLNFYGVEVRSLSIDNNLIHILSHMAVHAKYKFFGIRSIYDLCLFIKEYYDDIDFDYVFSILNKLGIEKFCKAIFMIINDTFGVKIENKKVYDESISKEELSFLLDCILNAADYKNNKSDFSIFLTDNNFQNLEHGSFEKVLKFIFPGKKYLYGRYKFKMKRFIYLPILWIRYIGGIIFRNGLFNTILSINLFVAKSNNKNKVIKIFNL